MKLSATTTFQTCHTPSGVQSAQQSQETAQACEDHVSIGETLKNGALKVAKAGVGVVGAGVGGVLGVLPGMTYGITRHFDDERAMYNLDTGKYRLEKNYHTNLNREADSVSAAWGLSSAVAGAAVAGVTAYLGIGSGPLAVLAAVAGGAVGVGIKSAFRSMGQHSVRLPVDSDVFTVSLTHAADKQLGSCPITGPISGAKHGMLEGAYFGKLAFQDILVPSLRPNHFTKY